MGIEKSNEFLFHSIQPMSVLLYIVGINVFLDFSRCGEWNKSLIFWGRMKN